MAMKTRAIRFLDDQEEGLKRLAEQERHGNVSLIVKRAVDLLLGLDKQPKRTARKGVK